MYDICMFNWLKMHFIPHEGNGHRPHILHEKNVHRIIGFVVFLEVFAFLIPSIAVISNADTGNILPSILSEQTNRERAQLNLSQLTVNPTLNKAAQEKADDMAANQYFAHTSPDGKTPWYWLAQVGYNYSYAGENLAINFTDAKDLTQAWMNSPTHRANITKTNYTQIGTGVAEGTYNGAPTIFVAQVFGEPALANAAPARAAHPPAEKVATAVSVASTPNILGAEKASAAAVSVPASSAPVPAPAPETQPAVTAAPVVASEGVIAPQHSNFFQRMIASPRNTMNILLFVILGIVALAVFLNIGIKISHHHPDLILNGVMAVAVIGCIFVMNSYISKGNISLIQSTEYSSTDASS